MSNKLYVKRSYRQARQETRTFHIAVEGQTEEIYFQSLANHLKIRAEIEIYKHDTDIKNTIETVKKKTEFSQIWLVFDYPQHTEHRKRFERAVSENQSNDILKFAISVPEFEVWFLFHFSSSTAPLTKTKLFEELKQSSRLPRYRKATNCFDSLITKLDSAEKNAKKIGADHQKNSDTDFPNPSSGVVNLVRELRALKEKRVGVK